VITADEGMRGGRSTPLKTNVDIAVAACDCVESVIVVQNTKGDVALNQIMIPNIFIAPCHIAFGVLHHNHALHTITSCQRYLH
jgi:acyl-coenzyme A synthetase/AMP-(fatty) acid ligase